MANYYRLLRGPNNRPASLAGGYWDDNAATEEDVETSAAGYWAGNPLVPAYMFGPDYASGVLTPTQTPVVI